MSANKRYCRQYREKFIENLMGIAGDKISREEAEEYAMERCHPEVLLARGMRLNNEGPKMLARKIAYEEDLY